MPLVKIQFQPGVNRSSTNYAAEGGWYSCDKVRFRNGQPQKIGGWVKYPISTPIEGTIRSLFNWVTIDKKNLMGIGTNSKFYVEFSGTAYDITPIRATTTLAANPVAAEATSQTLVITQPAHGAKDGDTVIISGATAIGDIPASAINGTFRVGVRSPDTFTIGMDFAATADISGGGSAVKTEFLLSGDVDIAVPGRGWNAGRWGRGAWGSRADGQILFSTMRTWSQDSFGEDLVFCTRDGRVYFWDYSEGFTKRAVPISAMPGATAPPVVASKILTAPQSRQVFAFGCNTEGGTAQDPLLIRWCDNERIHKWSVAFDAVEQRFPNAGELRLPTGNRIVAAERLKQEILVFTDGSIFTIQQVGGEEIFGLFPVADNISIIGPNAAIAVGNSMVWMGNDKFYTYAGTVATLPCPLLDYVFDDINLGQSEKIFAGSNEGFSEVWWFYCSADSNEVNRYVIYNYNENIWTYGSMDRTAWLDTPLKSSPVAAQGSDMYFHETGVDDDRTNPIHAWIESADIDIGDGDDFSFVRRLIPDVTFTGSAVGNPSVTITLTPRDAPGMPYEAGDSNTVRRTAVNVEQFDRTCPVRLRGRQIQFRIESRELGVQWRLGAPRIEVQPDGKK